MEGFDFEAARKHWDERGRPAVGSLWQSRNYPQLRVRVVEMVDAPRAGEAVAERSGDDVHARVYWGPGPFGLRGLFTYEMDEDRWNIDEDGVVYGAGGIDRDGRWRDEGPPLVVIFRREQFGGPDTWHKNFEDRTPFFEPVEDWDNSNPKEGTR